VWHWIVMLRARRWLARAVGSCVQLEVGTNVGKDVILSLVQRLGPAGWGGCGAGVAVAAAVAGAAVDPVRVHPTPAHTADEQARQQVRAGGAVGGGRGGGDGLGGDEVGFADQGRVGGGLGEGPVVGLVSPLHRTPTWPDGGVVGVVGALPVPDLPAGVARVGQD
jgi:hypothetical protein